MFAAPGEVQYVVAVCRRGQWESVATHARGDRLKALREAVTLGNDRRIDAIKVTKEIAYADTGTEITVWRSLALG